MELRQRLAIALGAAAVLHAALLVVLDGTTTGWRELSRPGAEPPLAAVDPAPAPLAADEVSVVVLVDPQHVPPPMAVWGPGDLAGFAATHPLPSASADRDGDRAADRGGGATGGPDIWTGRRDRLDDATLLAEPWNDGRVYRSAHDRTGPGRASSPEALHRQRAPAAGDRQVAALAKDGGAVASRGRADGIGAADSDVVWRDADPRFGLRPGKDQPQRKPGATQSTTVAAWTDRGAPSADVTRRGEKVRDPHATAAASKATDPDPYDMTPAQTGGAGQGVAGAPAPGALPDGRGKGDAATRADATRGARDLAIKATPQDPYFRKLFDRLAKTVQFPKDLALDLRAGRVVARFTLHPDGKLSDIGLHSSSGFRGFDIELLRSIGTLKDLGPVPARLLDGRERLLVLVVYEFRNPIVR